MPPRHLLHVFPTFATGGAQMRLVVLANRWGGKYRHSVISLDGVTAARARFDASVALELVPSPVVKGETLGNLPRIRRLLRAVRPDVLLTYNWGSIEWALANRFAPLVRQVHVEDGFGPEEATRQLPRRVWSRRLALGRATVVLPSDTLRRIALGTWRLSREHVLWLPNGIDVERFVPHGGEARSPLVIGTIATLREEKNIPRLMRAFAPLPPEPAVELRIIGGGPLLEALRAEAAALDSRIRLPGPSADPAQALAGLDLFALSSDTEQMPLSILEAMASGLAIVSTEVGDVKAMLPPPSRAWVTPRGNDAAFTAALARLAADAGERRALGAANRAHVAATYGEAAMVAAWDRLLGPASD